MNAWARRRERDLRALVHYRPRQVAWRGLLIARRRLASLAPGRWRRRITRAGGIEVAPLHPADTDPWIDFLLDPAVSPPQRADDLLEGRFRFLNHAVRFADRPDWYPRGAGAPSHLWRMNLHYHQFLVDAAVGALRHPERRDGLLSRAEQLLDDWEARCAVGEPRGWADAWNSYAVASRLLNARSARRASAHLEGPIAERFSARLDALGASSALFLERWIEWDLGGNHLLRDACALVAAGRWFRGPLAERWLSLGDGILREELRAQFGDDGFHFERSPMYQGLLIQDLLATLASPADGADGADGATRSLLDKAIAAQRAVLHPDGEIALFNDSAFGIAPRCDLLRRLAQRLGVPGDHAAPTDLANAGYFTLAAGGQRVVFDAGALGPDHLPAHAHCDALSFEWSVGTIRLVTDTGVDRYEAGPERDFQRSVRAHATLEVDGRDQGEPFGSFRMGRRPAVAGERVDDHTVRGSHDGFGNAGLHRRMLALRPGSGPSWTDRLDGPAEHAVTVRVGLSPEAHASVVEGRASIEAGSAGRWRWSTPPGGAVSIEVGTYCPQFGKNVPRNVLTWRGIAGRSRDLGFALIPAD